MTNKLSSSFTVLAYRIQASSSDFQIKSVYVEDASVDENGELLLLSEQAHYQMMHFVDDDDDKTRVNLLNASLFQEPEKDKKLTKQIDEMKEYLTSVDAEDGIAPCLPVSSEIETPQFLSEVPTTILEHLVQDDRISRTESTDSATGSWLQLWSLAEKMKM